MTAAVLTVEDVGKAFRTYGSEWWRVLSWLGVPVAPSAEHWALRHISFAVASGEAIGPISFRNKATSSLRNASLGSVSALRVT